MQHAGLTFERTIPCCRKVAWKDCRIASCPPKPRKRPPTLVNALPTLPCPIKEARLSHATLTRSQQGASSDVDGAAGAIKQAPMMCLGSPSAFECAAARRECQETSASRRTCRPGDPERPRSPHLLLGHPTAKISDAISLGCYHSEEGRSSFLHVQSFMCRSCPSSWQAPNAQRSCFNSPAVPQQVHPGHHHRSPSSRQV